MKKVFVVMLLLSYICTSCATVVEDNSPIKFDPTYINQQIQLEAIDELSDFKTTGATTLHLVYQSKNKIVFSPNYNLKIFITENDNWQEINEKKTIRPQDDIVLFPDIPISYNQLVSFFPLLQDVSKKYNMRVYVFGDMSTDDGIKQVAAFVDFVLTP